MLKPAKEMQIFLFQEGQLTFTFDVSLNKVVCSNRPSFCRAIEHFAYRGFGIDWVKTKINTHTIYITPPDPEMSKRELRDLINISTKGMTDLRKQERVKENRKKLSTNINNKTGKPMTSRYLRDTMERLKGDNYSRQDIVDWFNHFNIEEVRPASRPLMKLTTDAKHIIMDVGAKSVWKLFEQGKLIRYTKEEYLDKMRKYKDE